MDLEKLADMLPAHVGFKFTKTIHQKAKASTDPGKVTLPKGYTVAIIGAGKGIGEHIAKAYVAAKASNVIITARTASDLDKVKKELQDLAKQTGSSLNVSTCACDATKPESYVQIKSLIEKEYGGRLDCLVYNAGGAPGKTVFEDKIHLMADADWTNTTDLNYHGAFYAAKYLIPVLLNPQSIGKLLINITSGASHLINFGPKSYNIAKLAENRLTQLIGETYVEEGLVAVAVHPGATATPGSSDTPDYMKGSESIASIAVAA